MNETLLLFYELLFHMKYPKQKTLNQDMQSSAVHNYINDILYLFELFFFFTPFVSVYIARKNGTKAK